MMDLETLFRRIAPADIGSHPCYVLLASDIPAESRPGRSAFGFHSPENDLAYCSVLTSAGRWRGRGPCVVINDIGIASLCDELAGSDKQFRDELYEERIYAVFIHEASHALSRPFDLRPVPGEISPNIESNFLSAITKRLTELLTEPSEDVTPAPSWTGHDAHFIRCLIHVCNRAEAITGKRPIDSLLFDWRRFGLSPLLTYRRELEREIKAFDSTCTFAMLRECKPSQPFVEHWKNDLHAWWSQQSHDDAVVDLAAAMSPYIV